MIGLPPGLDRVIGLSGGMLDALMPMHLWASAEGRVVQAGPTLVKMNGQGDPAGQALFDMIELRRPSGAGSLDALQGLAGQRLGLALRAAPDLPLRGTCAVLPGAAGLILDISLGLSFARAVARFGLTLSDFSPCDQTVELLYLHEANASTMALSRHLTRRLEAARAAAERQALTDPLTGLANRRAMDMALARALADPMLEFGVLHVDLDMFKQVNDTHGHAAGDAVLERVGRVLRDELRLSDAAGRVGGDEFVVLLRDCADTEALGAVADRLIAALEVPVVHEGATCRISASIGLVSSAEYETRPDIDGLLADTDAALYAAKQAGRGRYVRADPGARRSAGPPPGGAARDARLAARVAPAPRNAGPRG